MKKKIKISICICLALIVFTSSFCVYAKSSRKVYDSFNNSAVVFECFCRLHESIHSDEDNAVYNTVISIYPDLIKEIKNAQKETLKKAEYSTKSKDAKLFAEFCKSKAVYEDFCTMLKYVKEDNGAKLYIVLLQLYPNWVSEIQKIDYVKLDENQEKDIELMKGVLESDNVFMIVVGCVIIVGVILVTVILRNKKLLINPNADNEEDIEDTDISEFDTEKEE